MYLNDSEEQTPLEKKLLRCMEFHAVLDEIWDVLPPPEGKREIAIAGFCRGVRELVHGQCMLLVTGHSLAAMTLIRPAFENLLKAIWAVQGASDAWVERFLTPPPTAEVKETAHQLSIKELLEDIKKHHPAHIYKMLQEFNDATIKAMHSFVHGGIYSVTHALVDIPEQQQVNLMLNSNGFLIMALNVIFMPFGGAKGELTKLQQEFSDCLPPVTYARH